MYSQVFDRRRLALPLIFPAVGGLIYLFIFDAPQRLILINAGALVLALAWIAFGRLPADRRVRLGIAWASAALLFVPLATGPEMGGVARWFPAGPITLHSAPLLLPLIAVLCAREEKWGAAPLALTALALALQSDGAALLALGLASAALAWLHRGVSFAALSLSAFGLAAFTFQDASLAPQQFTEGVLADAFDRTFIQGLGFAVMLFVIPLWHLVIDPQLQRTEGYAVAALLTGLGLAAVIAPYPYPLIGYGASPILGFGLALGAAARREQLRVTELFELMERTRE